MRAIDDIERELIATRTFELCEQVGDYFDLLDAAHGHQHARTGRTYFCVLRYIESRRQQSGVIDRPEIVAAAFWALVPPDDR